MKNRFCVFMRFGAVVLYVLCAAVSMQAQPQKDSLPYVMGRFEQQRDAGGRFGCSFAGLEGDVNGDGINDVLLSSAVQYSDYRVGRCYILSGKTGKALRTVSPRGEGKAGADFGISIGALLADCDGDGRRDFWIGDADTLFVASGATGNIVQALRLPSGVRGEAVAAADDLDGDTLPDLWLHADAGLYALNARSGALLYQQNLPGKRPPYPQTSLCRLGDVNGDKIVDWLALRLIDGDKAAVVVGDGATGKVLYSVSSPYTGKDKDGFGAALIALRDDANDDDIEDFAVAAPLTTLGSQTQAGCVYVFSGKDGKPLCTVLPSRPQAQARFGTLLQSLLDRSGDCIQDLVVGTANGNLGIFQAKNGAWIEDLPATPFAEGSASGSLTALTFAGGDLDKNRSDDLLLLLRYAHSRPDELLLVSPPTAFPPLRLSPAADSIRFEYDSKEPLVLSATLHPSYASYQWYYNNDAIPGATEPRLEVGAGGYYSVRVPVPCIETLEAGVEIIAPPSDTPVVVLLGRVLQVDREIVVSSRKIEVRVWDDKKEDGDRISLNFNGKWILDNHLLSWNQKVVPLEIEEGRDNIFCMFALNLGYIPPNTAAISIKDGKQTHFFVIRSDMRRTGTVRIVYKP